MERNFIIAGFGGQGVLLAGTILANSFMLAGSIFKILGQLITGTLALTPLSTSTGKTPVAIGSRVPV